MRKTLLIIPLLLCILLSSCVPAVETPADELRQYTWSAEAENGKTATLRFDDTTATLTVESDDFTLNLSGLCVLTDERLTICDRATSVNHTLSSILHGDRVELSYNSGTISLQKRFSSDS